MMQNYSYVARRALASVGLRSGRTTAQKNRCTKATYKPNDASTVAVTHSPTVFPRKPFVSDWAEKGGCVS
ncbi:MAG TPA: hypothetical protein PLJ27_16630 [Polyangiaceae bacterium]|nr:hypothetical protein [Polyangiaceae bacterium]HNZ23262.1 hypothetical protein [Polyangiaceae bacterium]HOD23304.1 hypothetical protein [Polyangiaceae bacterium]HOE50605.1 hypothetical protein [Polyangiaceae bacterium]HOH01000.1 hypothetical protein [Polyangiaceae bacterium]